MSTYCLTLQYDGTRYNGWQKQGNTSNTIQEKLETVIPVVENSFVTNLLLQNDWQDEAYYKQLLDVTEEYGYVMVIQFGTEYKNGKLVSPVGMNVRAQNFYPEFRAVVKSYLRCIIGPVMSNRVAVVVPNEKPAIDYEERIRVIEDTRQLLTRLENRLEAKFRAGIGRTKGIADLGDSYQEAYQALQEGSSRVIHVDDISRNGVYEGEFPAETEAEMYRMVQEGDLEGMRREANGFFDWMIQKYPKETDNIRLKVLEFVIGAERIAFQAGAVNYGFAYRKDYLSAVMGTEDFEELRLWFLERMTAVCTSIRNRKEEQSESAVTRAQNYIQENFGKDISLDDVSKEVNISPYYFSKLFKEESGENFIEYLTRIRMERAKEMLKNPELSIKELGMRSGYGDPNYFSRIFKKQTDMTPREYRERYGI